MSHSCPLGKHAESVEPTTTCFAVNQDVTCTNIMGITPLETTEQCIMIQSGHHYPILCHPNERPLPRGYYPLSMQISSLVRLATSRELKCTTTYMDMSLPASIMTNRKVLPVSTRVTMYIIHLETTCPNQDTCIIWCSQSYKDRKSLDWRCLEDGHLCFAILQVIAWYGGEMSLDTTLILPSMNVTLARVTTIHYKNFTATYSGKYKLWCPCMYETSELE